jgi:MscS family membrane protein
LTTLLVYAGAAWIFWLIASISLDRLMREWDKGRDRLNADLVRLSVRALSVIGSIAILAYGTQAIGFPVLGLFAGLGVGGIAVALAVRPTLENLIGGLILLTDRPVRVGDFCTVGDHTGTVEAIGLRSTMIRGLDRTLISIPNASFADMQIVNWARCDRMLIRATIGLRYETEADHLRFVLAKLREMFQRHPRIEQDTVRVRFAGYGLSTLDVDIRVYALTRDWNDFYAIREDVFFRVSEIVRESGTGFALPSQRLYLGRDEGLEEDQIRTARDEVASWRRSGEFPFPDPPASRVAGLAATLDYPPDGSPDSLAPQREGSRRSEPLSAEPQPDVSEGDPQTRMPGRR